MIDVTNLTLTIDGVEYIGADLEPAAQELLRHVIDLREQKQQLTFKLTQLDVADHAFSEALRKSKQPMQEAG
jgi:hypothetical protein